MKLIDTHIHVWNMDKVDYPWLKGDTSILRRNYALEELEPARLEAGVTGGVLVQAADSPEDTEWMLGEAEAHEWIRGVVGWVPLEDPEAVAGLLDRWGPGSLLKGVRHLIHNEAETSWLLKAPVLESLGLLAARDIPYDVVGTVPEHIETALKVAERWPGLRMVFDHLNQPQAGGMWQQLMREAAQHESFYVKISGLGGKKEMEAAIAFALHHFGADRCFCGGDWPVALLEGSYAGTWASYKSIIGKYTEERDKVFWETAERFYGLSESSNKPNYDHRDE